MSRANRPPRRPPRRRALRWIRAFAKLALVALVLLVLIWATRGVLLAPGLVAYLERYAERELGLELEIERLGGGWLSELRLEGVELRALEPGPIESLEGARTSIAYSLPALVLGAHHCGAHSVVPNETGQVHTTAPGLDFASKLAEIGPVYRDLSQVRTNSYSAGNRITEDFPEI